MDLTGLTVAPTYATGRQDLFGFLVDCLSRSIMYDRAAGYFSSTLYDVARVALSDFASRGGKIRLICSPYLDREDFEQMEAGLSLRAALDRALQRDIGKLADEMQTGAVLSYLATLVAEGTLSVRICYPEQSASGLFHTKMGSFTDRLGSHLAFIGSANETWRAWSELGNHESFAAFATWTNAVDAERTANLQEYFDHLWAGLVRGLVTRELPDAPRDRLLEYSGADSESLAEQVQALLERNGVQRHRESNAALSRKILQPHQVAVLHDWKRRDRRGIVAHVTGAGKTVTATAAIREWITTGRPALVVVPRNLLQDQWRKELRIELADIRPLILSVGGQSGARERWLDALPDQTRQGTELGPRITIAVLASASSNDFLDHIRASPDLLVVGDEMHTMAASRARRLLVKLEATDARLGLSATWQRAGDAEGTDILANFFGPELEPAFGIADAIAAGRLVPYNYNIETCAFSDDEQAAYNAISEQIARAVARSAPMDTLPDYLKMLLIKRARILKNAASKTFHAADIVLGHFKYGQHWLLYCDNKSQVRDLIHELDGEGLYALEYHSTMAGDRDATLAGFVEDGGVLVAIKCLDEGVDLPVLDHAVILASSTNPREYIQRRGRVLRTAPGKAIAHIWDLVTIMTDGAPASVNEVVRIGSFAADAYNREVVAVVDDLIAIGKISGQIDINFEDGDEDDTPY